MKDSKKKIGEILIEAGLIDELQLSSALGEQRQWGGRLCSILLKMRFVDEKAIASVLEKQIGQDCIPLEGREIPPGALKKVKFDLAKKYCIIPLNFDKGTLTIAMSDPTDLKTIDDLGFILGLRIKPVLALESGIKNAIAQHYEGIASEGKIYKGNTEDSAGDMEIVRIGTEKLSPALPEDATFKEKPAEKKEITPKIMVEAVVAILIEKGLITKEELLKKVREKSG